MEPYGGMLYAGQHLLFRLMRFKNNLCMIFLLQVMKNLKILNLSGCDCLERTPIFSSAEVNLERLILKSCKSLTEIDRSICHLKSLVSLDVSYCKKLQRLPNELGGDLASLE